MRNISRGRHVMFSFSHPKCRNLFHGEEETLFSDTKLLLSYWWRWKHLFCHLWTIWLRFSANQEKCNNSRLYCL